MRLLTTIRNYQIVMTVCVSGDGQCLSRAWPYIRLYWIDLQMIVD